MKVLAYVLYFCLLLLFGVGWELLWPKVGVHAPNWVSTMVLVLAAIPTSIFAANSIRRLGYIGVFSTSLVFAVTLWVFALWVLREIAVPVAPETTILSVALSGGNLLQFLVYGTAVAVCGVAWQYVFNQRNRIHSGHGSAGR